MGSRAASRASDWGRGREGGREGGGEGGRARSCACHVSICLRVAARHRSFHRPLPRPPPIPLSCHSPRTCRPPADPPAPRTLFLLPLPCTHHTATHSPWFVAGGPLRSLGGCSETPGPPPPLPPPPPPKNLSPTNRCVRPSSRAEEWLEREYSKRRRNHGGKFSVRAQSIMRRRRPLSSMIRTKGREREIPESLASASSSSGPSGLPSAVVVVAVGGAVGAAGTGPGAATADAGAREKGSSFSTTLSSSESLPSPRSSITSFDAMSTG
jgi:hypothetical protein